MDRCTSTSGAVFVLLALALSCQCVRGHDGPGVMSRSPCCVRDDTYQMRGALTIVADNDDDDDKVTSAVINLLAVDGPNQRSAVRMTVYGGGQRPYNITTIIDYKAKVTYTVLDALKKCYKAPLTVELEKPNCIPEDAVFVEDSKLGYGANSMTTESWMLRRGGRRSVNGTANRLPYPTGPDGDEGPDLVMFISVGQGNCVPVSEAVRVRVDDDDEDKFMRTFGAYNDYRPGVRDRSVFVIPDFCKDVMADGEPLPHPHVNRHMLNQL